MIVSDGWLAASKPRILSDDNKGKEKADFVVGRQRFKADLIPPRLLTDTFFSEQQSEKERLESEALSITQTLEELRDEHTGENGLLAAVADDGKISKAAITDRLKEIKNDRDSVDEKKMIDQYLSLLELEAIANKKAKEAQKVLDGKVAARYGKLTENEIKSLVTNSN